MSDSLDKADRLALAWFGEDEATEDDESSQKHALHRRRCAEELRAALIQATFDGIAIGLRHAIVTIDEHAAQAA